MPHRFALLLPAAAAVTAAAAPAAAEWRCDCTTIVDSCRAEIAVRERWVDVTTDHAQCARVDYFIDGMPFVAVVVEGRERQDWISRSAGDVLVQSCQVCRDNAQTSAPTAGGPGAATGGPASPDARNLTPLIRVEPAYPATADGAEGLAEIAFDVTERGTVENARIAESEPGEAFGEAALAAISRWRYPPAAGHGTVSARARLRFVPPATSAAAADTETPPDAAPRPGSGPGPGPRSECIRENAAYHYGDRVEVDLLNACGEPLAVFACAQGVDASRRWTCTDTLQRRRVLVSTADERVGASAPAADGEPDEPAYRYVDSFLLARAPNSEYWWVACPPSSDECRARASAWMRAVDGQPASVDPQARASQRLARSY